VGLCPTWWPPSEYWWRPLLKMMRSESSIIPFLVPYRKVWLMPTAPVLCSNAAKTGERKVNFAPGRIPLGGKSPQKCIYSIPAQQTAKHRAKFSGLPLSDVAAVKKPRCEPRNLLGCLKPANRSRPLVGRCCEEVLLFNKFFFPIVDTWLSCKDIARQSCAMVQWRRWPIFASCIFSEPRAAHFRPAF